MQEIKQRKRRVVTVEDLPESEDDDDLLLGPNSGQYQTITTRKMDSSVNLKPQKWDWSIYFDIEENTWTLMTLIVLFRILNAILCQTFFNPDEYWQSLEVAHHLVFGYGYLTWEWIHHLRSYAHPLLFAIVYKIISILQLEDSFWLILGPKLLQAVFAALTDVLTVKLARKWFGKSTAGWALFCTLCSYFHWFSGTRTFSNNIETALTMAAFLNWPWERFTGSPIEVRELLRSLAFAALACVMRPTNALIWMWLGIQLLFSYPHRWKIIMTQVAIVGSVTLFLSMALDWAITGILVFTPWKFVKENLFESISLFYGQHPWHWYLTNGFPVLVGSFLPLTLHGSYIVSQNKMRKFYCNPVMVVIFVMAIYSLLSHKEFRFLYPILPLCLLFSALSLGILKEKINRWCFLFIVCFILVSNVLPGLYLSLWHQRGVVDVMNYLRGEAHKGKVEMISFLMPCHSTPFQSYLHVNVPMHFLTCEPPLGVKNISDYQDEADLFYSNPGRYLRAHNKDLYRVSHFVFFDNLKPQVEDQFVRYKECKRFFNSHWIDDPRRKGDVVVYCKPS